MIGDEGPYVELNGPMVWVPRTVPYRKARGVAREAIQEYGQVVRYCGKVDTTLLGFVRDCRCDEVCELRWRDDEETGDSVATGDTTCVVPAWQFEIVEAR